VASACVDSRRNSNKKSKAGQKNIRQANQHSFHTIPVKENSTLPTPVSNEQENTNFSSKVQTHKNEASAQLQRRYAGRLPSQRLNIVEQPSEETITREQGLTHARHSFQDSMQSERWHNSFANEGEMSVKSQHEQYGQRLVANGQSRFVSTSEATQRLLLTESKQPEKPTTGLSTIE